MAARSPVTTESVGTFERDRSISLVGLVEAAQLGDISIRGIVVALVGEGGADGHAAARVVPGGEVGRRQCSSRRGADAEHADLHGVGGGEGVNSSGKFHCLTNELRDVSS
jgi:hypothetical protein